MEWKAYYLILDFKYVFAEQKFKLNNLFLKDSVETQEPSKLKKSAGTQRPNFS